MHKKILFVIIFVIVFIVGFALGIVYKNNQEGNLNLPIIIPQSCTLDGKTYKSGEAVPSPDKCNTCSCLNGEVACTLMYCE